MRTPRERRPGRTSPMNRMIAALLAPGLIAAVLAVGIPYARAHDVGDRFGPPRRAADVPLLRLPERIDECETHTVEICGVWTLQPDDSYRAAWSNGEAATLRVIDFGGTSMVIQRVDDGRGLTALYSGQVAEQRVYSGNVRWTTAREARTGSWRAEWDPTNHTGRDDFSRNSLADYRQRSDGGSHWAILDGTLVATGPANQSVLLRNEARLADGWVETVSSRADDGGLVLRARENGDYYLLAFRDDQAPDPRGSLNLALYHHLGSAYRELWNEDVAWPRGSRHTIRFEARGEWLSVFFDRELRAAVHAEARGNDPAPYTGPGGAGLRHYGADARWITSFDSFRWANEAK
ncbi:MAG TPA: hypothetical protein VFJ82_15330 [Longimicrobium sp.]|nr:hypothetical protein [Longimicrobium sp.]